MGSINMGYEISKKTKIHILVWGIFILHETVIIGIITGRFGSIGNYLVHYALNISLFYLHALIVLPMAFQQKSAILFKSIGFTTIEVVFYIFVVYFVDKVLYTYTDILRVDFIHLNVKYILTTLYRSVYFVGFATGYFFLNKYIKENTRANNLEHARIENIIKQRQTEMQLFDIENAYLRAQINPHFFFSSLNFLHNILQRVSPVADEITIALANMMRFAMLSGNSRQETSLSSEIDHVKNLIRVHQLRSSEKLHIRLEYKDEILGISIIPLLLITLVENIFKHGELKDTKHTAFINIHYDDNHLYIRTKNRRRENSDILSFNIGIENIKKRLSFRYGKEAEFSTFFNNGDQYHHAQIKIGLLALKVNHLKKIV